MARERIKVQLTISGLHHLSFHNRMGIKNSRKCCCFFCFAEFSPKEIEEWVDEGETARCPECGIDAVLPTAWVHTPRKLMEKLKKSFFDKGV